jgi:hypothetical protein
MYVHVRISTILFTYAYLCTYVQSSFRGTQVILFLEANFSTIYKPNFAREHRQIVFADLCWQIYQSCKIPKNEFQISPRADLHTYSPILCEHGPNELLSYPSVLPDGIFSNQKCQFGQIFECLAMKDVGEFYGHFVYFTAMWYFYGHLVYFVVFFTVLVF